MKNRDVLETLKKCGKEQLAKELISQIFELQKEILDKQEPRDLKDTMAMIGTAVELNNLSVDYPEVFKKFEAIANKNWGLWIEKSNEFIEQEFKGRGV
ncbi:MAG: hypothetical protein ACRDDH_18220 [Cetobacterium sp.]|uniref:hypothetical protein n=1 Tax=Cetobacterium sp. TaxID=2071632 RepID=UPI003EE48022